MSKARLAAEPITVPLTDLGVMPLASEGSHNVGGPCLVAMHMSENMVLHCLCWCGSFVYAFAHSNAGTASTTCLSDALHVLKDSTRHRSDAGGL